VITPLDCQDLVELITDYLESALPANERREFEEHLADCDGCTDYVAQMRTTVELTGRLRTDDIEPEIVEKLMAAFRGSADAPPG
jgi:anti-sigma factor RsiW